jgi:23S rRNA (uridine2552-2'-O)-methyltransferase
MPRRFERERRRDPFYRAAQEEGLRSRAAFKLAYLDDRFRLLRPGRRVLDLGGAPGGWSIVAADRVGPRGRVVAVDLRSIAPIDGVAFVRGRVGDPALVDRLGAEPFDLVISDLSPRISGAYGTDHARSVALVREAVALARRVLAPGGAFVAKVFDGDLVDGLEREVGASFARVRRTKPPASRGASSEIYLVATGFRPGDGRRGARSSDGPVPPESAM